MPFIPGRGGFGGPPRGGEGVGQERMPMGMEPRLVGGFKKGGKVKKTGAYKLHKGERVLTKAQQKSKKSDSNAFVAGKRA